MAYNSAYTGTQIDEAVGSVRAKEATWDAKQDALTGTQGQVVGFDADGNAEAQDAPSGLPEGGTTGQMLYKSESGAEWGDKPVMYVTVTCDDMGRYTADKTFAEITAAYDAGYGLFLAYDILVLPLLQADSSNVVFGAGVGTRGYLFTVEDSFISFSRLNISADTIDAVPTTRTINGHVLSADVTLDAADVGARPSTWTPTASDVGAVPTTRTVNGKALSSNITLSASDVSAVPTTRTVNGKALSANITLTADDVGAAPAITLTTATLTTSGWSSNSQTVTVSGVLADSSAQAIDVVPSSKTDATNWAAAGIWCTAQGANTLTFTCDTVPTANITVNVKIQGV